MYTLYYYPNNASLAPHFLLHHMGLDYELVLVDTESNAHKTEQYLDLNPMGRIPTLVVSGQPIFESPAICIHLCESHPEYKLMPPLGDPKRPLFFQWLAFLNNTLQAELMVRYYPHRHTLDENAIASIVAAQDERIADALKVLDDQLSKSEYLLGDSLSACDYFFFMLSEWALPARKSPIDFKSIAPYLSRMSQLPTIKKVCEIEEMDLSPFSSL